MYEHKGLQLITIVLIMWTVIQIMINESKRICNETHHLNLLSKALKVDVCLISSEI